MAHLRPCTGCARHVRANVTACPFCDASLTIDEAAPGLPREGLGRAARMAFGGAAVVAMTVAGCDKKENIAMPYGAPPNPTPVLPEADAAPAKASADPVAVAPDAAPPVADAASPADAGKKPPPRASAQVPVLPATSHPNVAKPYGAPPAAGYDIFDVV